MFLELSRYLDPHQGLLWAETRPPSGFRGEPFGFVLFLRINQQTDRLTEVVWEASSRVRDHLPALCLFSSWWWILLLSNFHRIWQHNTDSRHRDPSRDSSFHHTVNILSSSTSPVRSSAELSSCSQGWEHPARTCSSCYSLRIKPSEKANRVFVKV